LKVDINSPVVCCVAKQVNSEVYLVCVWGCVLFQDGAANVRVAGLAVLNGVRVSTQ